MQCILTAMGLQGQVLRGGTGSQLAWKDPLGSPVGAGSREAGGRETTEEASGGRTEAPAKAEVEAGFKCTLGGGRCPLSPGTEDPLKGF